MIDSKIALTIRNFFIVFSLRSKKFIDTRTNCFIDEISEFCRHLKIADGMSVFIEVNSQTLCKLKQLFFNKHKKSESLTYNSEFFHEIPDSIESGYHFRQPERAILTENPRCRVAYPRHEKLWRVARRTDFRQIQIALS